MTEDHFPELSVEKILRDKEKIKADPLGYIRDNVPLLWEYTYGDIDWEMKAINTPWFRIKHLQQVEPSLTYRQINHWESLDIVGFSRQRGPGGWRQFSIADVVSLLIIRDLRQIGYPMGWIKNLLKGLSSEIDSTLGRWSSMERSIYFALNRQEFTLVVSGEGRGSIVASDWLYRERKPYLWELSPYICLPFSEYIVRLVGALGEKLEPKRFYKPFLFRPVYNKIVELIRNNDYQEIHVLKDEHGISSIKTVRFERGEFSEDDLIRAVNKADFQTLKVVTRHGKIISLRSEERLEP